MTTVASRHFGARDGKAAESCGLDSLTQESNAGHNSSFLGRARSTFEQPSGRHLPLNRPPARGLDPDTNEIRVAISPAPRKRLGCKPFVDQTGNHACVEAERCEQRLRHAIAARGREQGERTALLSS